MNVNQIESEVMRLTRRVKAIHNGDWVAIGYGGATGWYARCPFGSVLPGRGDTPADALNEFERQLKIAEAKKQEAA